MAKILIIDDDVDFTASVGDVLEGLGHTVTKEHTTDTVLELVQSIQPELIILDVMFPEDSSAGFNAARLLRATDSTAQIPILLLTAVNAKFPYGFSAKDIDESMMPVNEFLEKPIDFDLLISKVNQLLG